MHNTPCVCILPTMRKVWLFQMHFKQPVLQSFRIPWYLHSWYQDILQSLQVLLINFIQKLFAFWITADLFMLKSIFKHFTYNHVLEVDHEYILFLANDWSRYIGTWAEKLFYCIKISFASHWWQCHCTLMFSSS